MKEEGTQSKAPLTEAFGQWKNAKIALLALLGLAAGQAVVWYTGQFYALFFLQQTLKVDGYSANLLIAWSLVLGTPGFVLFGWLSDKIGRKPIILAGCLIAALTYFPLFKMLTETPTRALPGAGDDAGDGHRRSRQLLVPVQSGRHGEVHQLLRHPQGPARPQLRSTMTTWRPQPARSPRSRSARTTIESFDAADRGC